ncbi:transposase [Microbulbifer sp. TRSA002]|uniref:transposase n=1 Tax=Microbulbifer sp. TRSA002 TaxID=3243382 RepID=UPI0040398334
MLDNRKRPLWQNRCRDWRPNQFRILISGLAYTLLDYVRRCGLKGTDAAHWQVRRLREKLLKIASVVTRNTRRIKLLASSTTP